MSDTLKTIGVIASLVMALGGAIGTSYVAVYRVGEVEADIAAMSGYDRRINILEFKIQGISRLSSIETKLAVLEEILNRVERKIPEPLP